MKVGTMTRHASLPPVGTIIHVTSLVTPTEYGPCRVALTNSIAYGHEPPQMFLSVFPLRGGVPHGAVLVDPLDDPTWHTLWGCPNDVTLDNVGVDDNVDISHYADIIHYALRGDKWYRIVG